jgi:hypothetical protein
VRLDLLTSELHRLVKPVLPHAAPANDPSLSLQAVRLELGPQALYAVATDRYTLAAERFVLPRDSRHGDWPPVHIDRGEMAAVLKMLPCGKDFDPELRITVDRSALIVSPGHTVDSWAVMIERPDDGTRLTLRDRRDPSLVDALANWRVPLRQALTRPKGRALDALDIQGHMLARWKDAARGAERLRVWTGPKPGDTILIAVERHFLGVMVTDTMLPDPGRDRDQLPWAAELLPGIDLRTASGVLKVDTESGEVIEDDGDG